MRGMSLCMDRTRGMGNLAAYGEWRTIRCLVAIADTMVSMIWKN